MSEIKQKRIKKELTCHYCYNFYHSIKRYATKLTMAAKGKNELIVHERECLEGLKVAGYSIACEKFKPTKQFWCEKAAHWITPEICLHRRKIKRTGCLTCKQFKQAVSLYIKAIEKEIKNETLDNL